MVGGKSDRFDRKGRGNRKTGRGDRFYRSSEKGLEFRALNLKHFWLDWESGQIEGFVQEYGHRDRDTNFRI